MSVQLALRNIRKSFSNKLGTVDVLDGLTFDINDRDFVRSSVRPDVAKPSSST